MYVALTREVSPTIVGCELTHVDRAPIDVDRARVQHARYEAALEAAGCGILRLPPEPELPDAVFVEDTAIVVDECAILMRPGAASRRPEVDTVAAALARYRKVVAIRPEATVDGGDVLRVGRVVYVGQSRRTNAEGLGQLRAILEPSGYRVVGVPVSRCLHLKSAASRVAEDTVLLNPDWVDPAHFAAHQRIDVDPAEPSAANGLLIGENLIYPTSFPRTRERLAARCPRILEVDLSELAKAEGAVTCCSIVVS